MANTIENLLTRNLLEVFGERAAVKRRFAIAALWRRVASLWIRTAATSDTPR